MDRNGKDSLREQVRLRYRGQAVLLQNTNELHDNKEGQLIANCVFADDSSAESLKGVWLKAYCEAWDCEGII